MILCFVKGEMENIFPTFWEAEQRFIACVLRWLCLIRPGARAWNWDHNAALQVAGAQFSAAKPGALKCGICVFHYRLNGCSKKVIVEKHESEKWSVRVRIEDRGRHQFSNTKVVSSSWAAWTDVTSSQSKLARFKWAEGGEKSQRFMVRFKAQKVQFMGLADSD